MLYCFHGYSGTLSIANTLKQWRLKVVHSYGLQPLCAIFMGVFQINMTCWSNLLTGGLHNLCNESDANQYTSEIPVQNGCIGRSWGLQFLLEIFTKPACSENMVPWLILRKHLRGFLCQTRPSSGKTCPLVLPRPLPVWLCCPAHLQFTGSHPIE